MHKIILDTDPGVDDAMAIAYAFLHPDIELLALTTVFGNINIDFATRNAQFILDTLGATDVAVAKGAAIPSVQSPLPHAEFVHGLDGAKAQPGEITLVAVGPLTNIYEAFRREPTLPSLVAGLVVMGGTLDEPGNVSPLAEANFFNDPHAADALMSADWPMTVVGLDVTHRIMVKESHSARCTMRQRSLTCCCQMLSSPRRGRQG